MKLYLVCPECGGKEWNEWKDESGYFICEKCGATCSPEEMEAEVEE